MSEITIRRFQVTDLPDFKVLRDAMLEAHPNAFTSDAAAERHRTPESYRSRLANEAPAGGVFLLGAWQAGMLVGSIGCERDFRVKVRHIGHLTGMMVREHARGQGVASALLAESIAIARRANGIVMLTLNVTATNLAAIRLYQRAGFICYGTLQRAIRVAGRFHAKDQMALALQDDD